MSDMHSFLGYPVAEFENYATTTCPPGISFIFSKSRDHWYLIISYASPYYNGHQVARLGNEIVNNLRSHTPGR